MLIVLQVMFKCCSSVAFELGHVILQLESMYVNGVHKESNPNLLKFSHGTWHHRLLGYSWVWKNSTMWKILWNNYLVLKFIVIRMYVHMYNLYCYKYTIWWCDEMICTCSKEYIVHFEICTQLYGFQICDIRSSSIEASSIVSTFLTSPWK